MLVRFPDGKLQVVAYMTWKHKLKGVRMAEWKPVFGTVQHFPGKDVIAEREVGGQIVREFTVKSITTDKLVRVSAWPEYPEFDLVKGDFVCAEGPVQVNESGGNTYYNLTARSLVIMPALAKTEDTPQRGTTRRTPSF